MSDSATRWASSGMTKVSPPATKNRARKLTIISAEPNSVNRKNLMAAYWLLAAPHADEEVHRQQHDLEEHEEQDQVLGHEGAQHAGVQHQQQDEERLGVRGSGKWFHE